MSKKWYPVINYETCTECGACVGKCSHGVYDKSSSKPQVINPEGCIDGCRGCQDLCPSQSIQYAGDTGAAKNGGCSCSCGCDCSNC